MSKYVYAYFSVIFTISQILNFKVENLSKYVSVYFPWNIANFVIDVFQFKFCLRKIF